MDYGRLCEDSDLWGYDASFDVEGFLGFLNSPRLRDAPGFGGWVQTSAKKQDINPRMLLAIAQKEQSFLTRPGSGDGWQRAQDWTMGYGATDSGDLAKYEGTQNQVASAAAGLRGYRDRGVTAQMVGKPLGKTMGSVGDKLTAEIVPENQATAALYLYTPHRSGAEEFAAVWAWLGEREEAMKTAQKSDGGDGAAKTATTAPATADAASRTLRDQVVSIARRVAEAHRKGAAHLAINGVNFAPGETGYCARFVRQVYEAALDVPEHTWAFGAASARDMEQKLKAAGKAVPASARLPGDIVAFNRNWPNEYGHIAVYLGRDGAGRDLVAEDGSSGISVDPVGDRAPHISGYYAVLPASGSAPGPVKVVLLPGSAVVDCSAELEGDQTRCALRPLAEALGAEVYDHIADQRKVYVRRKGTQVAAAAASGAAAAVTPVAPAAGQAGKAGPAAEADAAGGK